MIGKESKFVGTLMQTTETGDVVRVPEHVEEWNPDTTYVTIMIKLHIKVVCGLL